MTVINKEELLYKMVYKLNHEESYSEEEKNGLLEGILMVYGAKPDKDAVPFPVFKMMCDKCNKYLDELEEMDRRNE